MRATSIAIPNSSPGDRPGIVLIAWLAILGTATVEGGVARAESGGMDTRGAVEVRHLKIDTDHRLEDVRGLHIGLRYRVGAVEVEKALFLVARVFTSGGAKVKTLAKSAAFRDRNDGALHGKKQLTTVPRGAWRETSIFIPFYAMKLTPGVHKLGLRFEAVSDPGKCKFGERPRLVRIIGDNQTNVELTKPPYKLIQVLVSSTKVVEEAADVSLWPWRARPDLKWRLRFRAGAGGVMHNSKVRDDTYSASWNQYSPEFPFSQGDLLSLSILDQDVMSHDELGILKLSLDDLIKLRSHPHPLKAGKISSLVLGSIKLR